MKHEVAGADQAVIDLGFDAIQRDDNGDCRTKDTNADGLSYARFVPYNNQEMASADTNKEVIIDSCSLDSTGTTERTYMSANPYSNPSNRADGFAPTVNPAEARNNWWYVYYKFTAVDDAKILADQVFSMALSISKTSERSGGGTPSQSDVDTGHTSGVTFYNDMTKVAIYVVDNDGGKAAVCKSRDCMVCTTYNDAGECSLVTDTTSEYLSTIPEVVEGEESVQFFLVLKVAPTKPVYITITPTSNVYVKIVLLVLLRSLMPVAL